jgi:cell division protein FtsL
MRDLSLTLSQPIFNVKKKSKTLNPVWVLRLNIMLLALTVVFGFAYLFQVNSLGTQGYEIRQKEQQVKNLQVENKSLQIQSSSLSSITRIQQVAESMNMVPANDAVYIKDAGFALK